MYRQYYINIILVTFSVSRWIHERRKRGNNCARLRKVSIRYRETSWIYIPVTVNKGSSTSMSEEGRGTRRGEGEGGGSRR